MMERIAAGILIWLMALLALAGCAGEPAAVPCGANPHCLVYGISADIPILDLHLADSAEAGMIFRQIYDTLVYRDPDTRDFVPGLASSWGISEDGLIYTFHLRQDIVFHDNTRLTAAAVARNIDRIYDPEMNALHVRSLLGPLSRYKILDEFTIQIHLLAPYIPLLDGLAQPFLGIASPQALDAYNSLRYQFHQVGTGPFMLDSYVPGDRIVLQRNSRYAGDPSPDERLNGAEISRVEIIILSDESRAVESILSGRLDVIDSLLPAATRNLAGNSKVQLVPTNIPGQTVQFLLNTSREHLGSRLVRQALLYATNRIAIRDSVFFNYSPIAWAPLSQSTGLAHTGYVNQFAYNIGLAQELLESAGYEDTNSDGILDRDNIPLELRMIVPPWGQLPEVAAVIKEQWQSIGIELTIEPVHGIGRLLRRVQSGEFDLFPVERSGLEPSILGAVFLDHAQYRFPQTQNEQLISLLRQAAAEQDPLARRDQYFQIQSILMNEALILPIRENVKIRGIRSNIRNLDFDAYGLYPLLHKVRVIEP